MDYRRTTHFCRISLRVTPLKTDLVKQYINVKSKPTIPRAQLNSSVYARKCRYNKSERQKRKEEGRKYPNQRNMGKKTGGKEEGRGRQQISERRNNKAERLKNMEATKKEETR